MAKKRSKPRTNISKSESTAAQESDFDVVIGLIKQSQAKAVQAVNTTLIELYWRIGEFIAEKTSHDGWGKGTVEALAKHIQARQPNASGYSARNLWRMMQFFQTYNDQPKLSPLVTELSWTHNLLIMSRCKRDDEREFYLRMAAREKWSKRELERQLKGSLFERVALSPPNLSPSVAEIHPEAETVFKDSYLIDFLQLSEPYSEADLEHALIERLKDFLIELGRDFCFVGRQFNVQVGGRDFAIDLLFFHRGLNCLVAIELKIEEFQPEHLGKLEFYLEALDRDVKKKHEHPSIGVLLCATKDQEVVEFALSRAMSPALVAEYQTQLPDKELLQAKLHEFYELAESQARLETDESES